MNKEKRNIQQHANKEVKHLMVLLDKSEASEFKKMVPELQDTWRKKQMFRTETEMRFSVLSDNKYGTKAAKYWQSVREQNTHFENLMHLSFEYRKNDVEIEKLEHKIKKDKDKFERKMAQIELEEKLYSRASMELVAKARMREISTWSKLKKEFHDGSFDDKDVNTHQAESYTHQLEQKKLTLTPGSSQPEVFNVLGQLETLKRVRQSGELKYDGANRKSISKKPAATTKS
jgi:type IV secretory pathway VirB4 component